ncbi:MAG TPA: hypothetical protein VJB87_04210 [Candidatus Nanoarchaeia archaeon]|nr:hypothetical protein [Candidatus Nanoarchaeia archaeon]
MTAKTTSLRRRNQNHNKSLQKLIVPFDELGMGIEGIVTSFEGDWQPTHVHGEWRLKAPIPVVGTGDHITCRIKVEYQNPNTTIKRLAPTTITFVGWPPFNKGTGIRVYFFAALARAIMTNGVDKSRREIDITQEDMRIQEKYRTGKLDWTKYSNRPEEMTLNNGGGKVAWTRGLILPQAQPYRIELLGPVTADTQLAQLSALAGYNNTAHPYSRYLREKGKI